MHSFLKHVLQRIPGETLAFPFRFLQMRRARRFLHVSLNRLPMEHWRL